MAKRTDVPKVYCATFPNGKKYIGITTATLELRKSEHYSRAKIGPRYAVHNALNIYGDNVHWETLHMCSSYEEAKELEIKLIKELKSMYPNGYNLTAGGDGTKNIKMTEQHKKNLSISHQGYVMPESQKQAISLANKGKKKPDGFGAKVSAAQKGRIPSASQIENIRKSKCKEFDVFHKNSLEFVGRWLVIRHCAKDLGISEDGISECLLGKQKTCGGYIFKRIK
jgi:group I intron endonuclease